ncbi:MAG: hypothetical protein PHR03_03710 [Desulfovibrionales bacterium]|nr:hypothetical protein [Desulfovibrionales bacterium]
MPKSTSSLAIKINISRLRVFLITSKILDARRRGASEDNAADDVLMVDQGYVRIIDTQ